MSADSVDHEARASINVVSAQLQAHLAECDRHWKEQHKATAERWAELRVSLDKDFKAQHNDVQDVKRAIASLNKRWWAIAGSVIAALFATTGGMALLIIKNAWLVQ